MRAFAAPFVLVVACSRPAPERLHGPRGNPPAPLEDDAGVDAPAPIDASMVETAPLPAGETARIIAVGVVGADTVATIGAGTNKGVTKDSKICVVDAKDATRCLPGGDLEIIEVKANVTKARTGLTIEQLRANPRALVR